jgi:carbonic anhydrase/acetyltransferase-like protein (isoleucine patch superfamily)
MFGLFSIKERRECNDRSGIQRWFNSILRGDNAPIIIGEKTNIQDGCTLHVNPNQPVTIGNEVSVGHNVILHGCTVNNGALIGMGAIILDDVEIGEQALVAAGSLIPTGKKYRRGHW